MKSRNDKFVDPPKGCELPEECRDSEIGVLASVAWYFLLRNRVIKVSADGALVPYVVAYEEISCLWGIPASSASADDALLFNIRYEIVKSGGEIRGVEFPDLPELPDAHPVVWDAKKVSLETVQIDHGVFFV